MALYFGGSFPYIFDFAVCNLKTDKKFVVLTFDDGPHPKYTEGILNVLDAYQIKATFFMVGKQVKKYPHIAKKVVDAGHDIGNHSYSHSKLVFKNPKFIWEEISKTDSLIRQIDYKNKIQFRSPYARRGWLQNIILLFMGKKNILFDVDSQDWERNGVDLIYEIVINQVQPGSIILFHDGGGPRQQTIDALSQIIDRLRFQGYEFVTLSKIR